MSELILWAVSCNDDLTEGRGREYVKHFCRLHATARRLAKRGYVQGTDCPVYPVTVLVLDGQYVLPVSLINVVEPINEDTTAQVQLDAGTAALQRAKQLGLSDDEIKAIVKSGGFNA